MNFQSIQFLRFVAALGVVIFHSVTGLAPAVGVTFPNAVYVWAKLGTSGVHVFFFISGFVMMVSSLDRFGRPGAWAEFLKRRCLRIYPIYWISASIYFAGSFIVGPPYDLGFGNLLAALLLIPGSAAAIISPGWTLGYEMYFYIIFGALLWLRPLPALITLTLGFATAILLGAVTDIRAQSALISAMTSPLLAEFVAGCWIAVLSASDRMSSWIARAWLSWVLFALAVIGYGLFAIADAASLPQTVSLGLPSLALFAAAISAEKLRQIPKLINRMAWLGDSSYALYLIHILIISLLSPYLAYAIVDTAGLVGAVVIASVTSVIAGFAVHYGLERPLMNALRRR